MLLLIAQPAWAVCGGDEVCVVIPAGSSAMEIADLIKGSWDLPDFACGADIVDEGVRVTATANDGTRVLQFIVPESGTGFGYSIRLRFALAFGNRSFEPFKIFLTFENSAATWRATST